MCFDLAPGWELFYNMSRDAGTTREFFVKYADRILYGTDIESGLTLTNAGQLADDVARWLESRDSFREVVGYGVLQGIGLPESVLTRILHGNFERMVGSAPRVLQRSLACEECERIADESDALADGSAGENPARQAVERLR